MGNEAVNTAQLNGWIDRMRGGDPAACDEMLRSVCKRLERLAHKMIRRYPDVRRWAQTDDILQSALMRLLHALHDVRPASVQDFFGLAAEQMRRQLLDLTRHYRGARGLAANHESGAPGDGASSPVLDPPDPANDVADLERWEAFHAGVAALPVAEREVVGLIFYHGWTQRDVAALLQIHERTVRRRWESSLRKLRAVASRQDG
jgi:RNA polymerase sigma-70 factor (ECF subfamily)